MNTSKGFNARGNHLPKELTVLLRMQGIKSPALDLLFYLP